MKIEVGKAYRTRGGWKAVVEDDNYDTGVVLPYPLLVDHDGHGRIKHAANGKYWSDNDRHSHNNSNAEFDLISEWTDEPAAALDEKILRYEDALHYLIERADDSNDARYGTLSASFVRDVCSKALEGTA